VAETAARDAPVRLRAAIVDRARRDGAAPAAPRASLWSGLFRPVPLAVPLALAAVLVIALVGYGAARRDWPRARRHSRIARRSERGITTLELAAPLGSGDTVAVTAEPPGGVDSPTGPPVLLGKS
jgi:hypothetical protein